MSQHYEVAIIGAGPAGLSAAARAAEAGLSHILLESSPHLANTIYRYQKGKLVMAEPGQLPLRSPMPFEAGKREVVLEGWSGAIRQHHVNLVMDAAVRAIDRHNGRFVVEAANGHAVTADKVVLAIGLQGNIRKLGVEGEDLHFVQYQLDDAGAYHDEEIVVVGAGDAAIENAVALSAQNNVIMVNRSDEFARAKDANRDAVLKAIESGRIRCFYNSAVRRVVAVDNSDYAGKATLDTAEGVAEIDCHRVIARIGAIPPRRFVESCGIVFPSEDRTAIPEVSARYESNVPGLYIIGALGGYPLIKQALNQGYEVIEFIRGIAVAPADQPLLEEKFSVMPGYQSVDATLRSIRQTVPLLSDMTTLQLREFLLDSVVHTPKPKQAIFRRNDYSNSFYSVLSGQVHVEIDPRSATTVTLGQGEFFGEMSLISGRRRNATVRAGADCVLLETPRRTMVKLISSMEGARRVIDEAFIMRAIETGFTNKAPSDVLRQVAATAEIRKYRAGEVLFREGDEGSNLHLIRSGSVTVSRRLGHKDVVLAYVAAGNYVGEMALLGNTTRSATVTAAVAAETITLEAGPFMRLLDCDPDLRQKMEQLVEQRTLENVVREQDESEGEILSFLLRQGVGEATDVLLIDESLCVHCDNCETACAETHGGTSRLNRKAGPSYAMVHVPTSCRHCEHPHCMKDCPPDAIRRAPNGEVYIQDNCIGCGNCERNCPYDVIQMAHSDTPRRGLLLWQLFGLGAGPGEARDTGGEDSAKKAVKCDMCKDLRGGPACVRSCPTGAAIRISPEALPGYLESVRR
ncbi:MAG: cyclic nucleotide-binding domain-containing protein [Xanthomonadales bacterium]|nr:cyclic nucleotide-binding domain-containing protein [Xanthomonadales bacterium]